MPTRRRLWTGRRNKPILKGSESDYFRDDYKDLTLF